MDKYKIIKNGLVLTLDKNGSAGFFNIIIKNDKIFLIDYEKTFNEKEFRTSYPDAEIIDAKYRLIMPGFFNSKSVSTYTLNKIFFKKCSYQNINSWQSLRLVEKFLSAPENSGLFSDLLKITYTNSLLNGEIFINECSPNLNKEFTESHYKIFTDLHQYFNITVYDQKSNPDIDKKISAGFFSDENTNNYSLTSLKKILSGTKAKLVIEASFSESTYESIKNVFGKNLIPVLAEMDLITSNTVISNPTHLNQYETEILTEKNASVLICPSDYLNLSYRKTDLSGLIQSGVNVITGTGYTGNSILSELRKLQVMTAGSNISPESIFKTAVQNPANVFGISNLTGTIEKNKFADMIMFDLKDTRNTLTLPEADPDFFCDMILEKLCEKDICDVIIKGEYLVENGKQNFNYKAESQNDTSDVTGKIYSAGKYYEYREKTLMKNRIDKLGLSVMDIKNEEKPLVYVDMTHTGEYVGDGEFAIIGKKEEEVDKPREKSFADRTVRINVEEVQSIDKGLNFFEDIADMPVIPSPKITGRKVTKTELTEESEKTVESEMENNSQSEQKGNSDKITEMENESIIKEENENRTETVMREEPPAPPVIKKTKLKFGFKDGE